LPDAHRGVDYRNLPPQAVLLILLHEAHAIGADRLHADDVDVLPQLRDPGSHVRSAQRRVDLLDDLAARFLEGARPRRHELERPHAVRGDDSHLTGLSITLGSLTDQGRYRMSATGW